MPPYTALMRGYFTRPRNYSMTSQRELDVNSYAITDMGIRLVGAIAKDDHERIHQILMQYEPYRVVDKLLENRALTIQEIAEASSMNQVAAETVLRLLEWASPSLRRSKKHTYYIAHSTAPSFETYAEKLENLWRTLAYPKFGIKREYVRIPDLRDGICEILHIDAPVFDNLFLRLVQMFPNRFELSSAPAPVICASKEEGVRMGGRRFFYVRMTDRR